MVRLFSLALLGALLALGAPARAQRLAAPAGSPNPLTGSVFTIPYPADVAAPTVEVFDVLGRRVAAGHVPTGVYVYRLRFADGRVSPSGTLTKLAGGPLVVRLVPRAAVPAAHSWSASADASATAGPMETSAGGIPPTPFDGFQHEGLDGTRLSVVADRQTLKVRPPALSNTARVRVRIQTGSDGGEAPDYGQLVAGVNVAFASARPLPFFGHGLTTPGVVAVDAYSNPSCDAGSADSYWGGEFLHLGATFAPAPGAPDVLVMEEVSNVPRVLLVYTDGALVHQETVDPSEHPQLVARKVDGYDLKMGTKRSSSAAAGLGGSSERFAFAFTGPITVLHRGVAVVGDEVHVAFPEAPPMLHVACVDVSTGNGQFEVASEHFQQLVDTDDNDDGDTEVWTRLAGPPVSRSLFHQPDVEDDTDGLFAVSCDDSDDDCDGGTDDDFGFLSSRNAPGTCEVNDDQDCDGFSLTDQVVALVTHPRDASSGMPTGRSGDRVTLHFTVRGTFSDGTTADVPMRAVVESRRAGQTLFSCPDGACTMVYERDGRVRQQQLLQPGQVARINAPPGATLHRAEMGHVRDQLETVAARGGVAVVGEHGFAFDVTLRGGDEWVYLLPVDWPTNALAVEWGMTAPGRGNPKWIELDSFQHGVH